MKNLQLYYEINFIDILLHSSVLSKRFLSSCVPFFFPIFSVSLIFYQFICLSLSCYFSLSLFLFTCLSFLCLSILFIFLPLISLFIVSSHPLFLFVFLENHYSIYLFFFSNSSLFSIISFSLALDILSFAFFSYSLLLDI